MNEGEEEIHRTHAVKFGINVLPPTVPCQCVVTATSHSPCLALEDVLEAAVNFFVVLFLTLGVMLCKLYRAYPFKSIGSNLQCHPNCFFVFEWVDGSKFVFVTSVAPRTIFQSGVRLWSL